MGAVLRTLLALVSSVEVVANGALFTHLCARATTILDPVTVLVDVTVLFTEVLAFRYTLTPCVQVITVGALGAVSVFVGVQAVVWEFFAFESVGQVVSFDTCCTATVRIGLLTVLR